MFEVTEEMVMYTFRYALGKMTYSTSTVSDYLIENWHRFKPHTKDQIIDEINEAVKRNQAGMQCDIDNWKRIVLLERAVRTGDKGK